MSLIRAGIHKMLVRIANMEAPDQTALGLHCLSKGILTGKILDQYMLLCTLLNIRDSFWIFYFTPANKFMWDGEGGGSILESPCWEGGGLWWVCPTQL